MERKKLRTVEGIDHSKEDFLSAINFDEEKREDVQKYINVIANQMYSGEISKSEAFQKICEEMSIEELAQWIVSTYLLFGSEVSTAHKVASVFVKGIEKRDRNIKHNQ